LLLLRLRVQRQRLIKRKNSLKLIVGLGNPGSQYAATRHNAGRLLIEAIARRNSLQFEKKKRLESNLASLVWESSPVTFACLETYMNASGPALKRLVDFLSVNPEKDLLVLVDDSAIAFGKLRLRSRGSAGGHNGLKSIEESFQTANYARLRIGIGPSPDSVPLEEYVLSPFLSEEKKAMNLIQEKGAEACRLWAIEPITKAMNVVNGYAD